MSQPRSRQQTRRLPDAGRKRGAEAGEEAFTGHCQLAAFVTQHEYFFRTSASAMATPSRPARWS
jgi:hypothetical protein